jgi:hypothetical protein
LGEFKNIFKVWGFFGVISKLRDFTAFLRFGDFGLFLGFGKVGVVLGPWHLMIMMS